MAGTEEVYDLGGFLSERSLSRQYHDNIKVLLVQSQNLDVRLISQIDIVMCFIYNVSAMSYRCRG